MKQTEAGSESTVGPSALRSDSLESQHGAFSCSLVFPKQHFNVVFFRLNPPVWMFMQLNLTLNEASANVQQPFETVTVTASTLRFLAADTCSQNK